MVKKILFVLFVLFVFAVAANADMVKGSVGGGGHKSFGFAAEADGQITVTMIYDNSGADLDLIAGTQNNSGDVVVLGMGISSGRNYETMTFGVQSDTIVAFLVTSYKGSSPFHVYVSDANGQSVRQVSMIEIKEDKLTSNLSQQLRVAKTQR